MYIEVVMSYAELNIIKGLVRLNCYRSVQNLLSSSLLSKNIKV